MTNTKILVLSGKLRYLIPNSTRPADSGWRGRLASQCNISFAGISKKKRAFDLVLAGIGIFFIVPIIFCTAILVLLLDGRPVFYVSERMKTPGKPFKLIKFRTMRVALDGDNAGVTGGDKENRITKTGRVLRRFRLDETPQILNILRGDMSFVGPRPPLRQYTDAFPDIYEEVLRSRPGVTGLATLHYHRYEERLISHSKSPAKTEEIYTNRCIPRKAALDLIYQRHASIWFDAVIIWQTVVHLLKR